MIIQFILDLLLKVVNAILSFLDVLPSFPSSLVNGINTIFSYMTSAINMVNFILPFDNVKVAIPIAIAVINFENIYRMVMWIVRKLPVSTE